MGSNRKSRPTRDRLKRLRKSPLSILPSSAKPSKSSKKPKAALTMLNHPFLLSDSKQTFPSHDKITLSLFYGRLGRQCLLSTNALESIFRIFVKYIMNSKTWRTLVSIGHTVLTVPEDTAVLRVRKSPVQSGTVCSGDSWLQLCPGPAVN